MGHGVWMLEAKRGAEGEYCFWFLWEHDGFGENCVMDYGGSLRRLLHLGGIERYLESTLKDHVPTIYQYEDGQPRGYHLVKT
jgi:hypothetical protein